MPRVIDGGAALTENIISLARQYGRYGYRRITALLRAKCLSGIMLLSGRAFAA
ncbi:hypothetical protein GCM10011504_59240 [Siccirubricoccus deserti]|nr:hypothetical protein GCM10011504_59240 [Siccirubricoccus deserti]